MGTENEYTSEISNETTLIDFLYIDKQRVDSLISQLRQGTLRSVTKTIGETQGTTKGTGLSIQIAKGDYSNNQTNSSSSAEQYDPYHSQIIQLLNDLNIDATYHLPHFCTGQLMLLPATITIRDIATIKKILPLINKHIPVARKDREFKKIMDIASSMIESMPNSITIALNVNNQSVTGTLLASGLSISQEDLTRTYGVNLPDSWFTLGIVDSTPSTQANISTDNINHRSIDETIDTFVSIFNNLYASSSYKIIPIIIFRPIHTA